MGAIDNEPQTLSAWLEPRPTGGSNSHSNIDGQGKAEPTKMVRLGDIFARAASEAGVPLDGSEDSARRVVAVLRRWAAEVSRL